MPEEQQVETNVRRFHESVHATGADEIEQVKCYDEGVGTHWFDRFAGGTTGAGLDLNILEGYRVLAENYQDDDEVYVLGFSRGAYTARSLVGMIRDCGLIKKRHLGFRTAMAYGIYCTRDDGVDSKTARLFRSMFSREIKIKFVGVWDTVGALGVPLEFLSKFNMKLYEFHSDMALRWMQDRASELGLKLTPREVLEDNYSGRLPIPTRGFSKAHTRESTRGISVLSPGRSLEMNSSMNRC